MIAVPAVFWMMVGHAVADFPLQGEFLSQAKNRNTAIGAQFWRWALPAHGLIHGGAVALATGSVELGMAETVAHCVIDFAKCEGWLGVDMDQFAHLLCKIVWTAVLLTPML